MKNLFLSILTFLAVHTLTFSQEVSTDVLLSSGRIALTDGDFSQTYSLSANGNGSIKKALLYGKFNYTYSNERDAGFSMLYTPGSYTFYYTDTIRGDIHREQYTAKAGISYPFCESLSVGLDFSLMLGSKAKQRDIRNKNTVNDLTISPSVSWHFLTASYLFSQYREEASLKRFGPDVVIPITASEGLFFGTTEAYGSKHNTWYYNTINNGVSIRLNFKKILPTIKYVHTSSDINTHVDEQKIGRENRQCISLVINFTKETPWFDEYILLSYANKNSFTPIGKKESNGNSQTYKYFGEVKRHNDKEVNIELHDIICLTPSDESDFLGIGGSYVFSKKTQTHFVVPQEYEQILIGHKWSGHTGYRLPFGLIAGCLISVDRFKGDMLILKNEALGEQKYNHNADLLWKEWQYLIASREQYELSCDYTFNLTKRGYINAHLALNLISTSINKQKNINFKISYNL